MIHALALDLFQLFMTTKVPNIRIYWTLGIVSRRRTQASTMNLTPRVCSPTTLHTRVWLLCIFHKFCTILTLFVTFGKKPTRLNFCLELRLLLTQLHYGLFNVVSQRAVGQVRKKKEFTRLHFGQLLCDVCQAFSSLKKCDSISQLAPMPTHFHFLRYVSTLFSPFG